MNDVNFAPAAHRCTRAVGSPRRTAPPDHDRGHRRQTGLDGALGPVRAIDAAAEIPHRRFGGGEVLVALVAFVELVFDLGDRQCLHIHRIGLNNSLAKAETAFYHHEQPCYVLGALTPAKRNRWVSRNTT